jgi:predicted RNase H-like nuclease
MVASQPAVTDQLHTPPTWQHSVVGVDGCRAGWIGIVIEPGPSAGFTAPAARVHGVFGDSIDQLVTRLPAVAVIAIDIPIHPPDDGVRPCDLAAKQHLGGRKQSSLFLTPTRAALEASTYQVALERARASTAKGISVQAWALRSKILEVDTWMATAPCPVFEVHPEISFSLMTGSSIQPSKSTWAGFTARNSALRAQGITLPDDIGTAGTQARIDDILDAAAAAWSAHRIASGTAVSFPDPPVALPNGRVPAIWA